MTGQNMALVEEILLPIQRSEASASFPPPRHARIANCKKVMTHLELYDNSGRNSPWVESMRASSPTQVRSVSFLTAAHSQSDSGDWNKRFPSALSKLDEITAAAKGKKIAMFLDYDGTLSPIVDDPDSAFMSEGMRATVKEVAKHFPTAIVSGRCRDKVFGFVQLSELYYAGSHGMDIKGPTELPKHTNILQPNSVLCQPASAFLPLINEVHNKLLEKTKLIPGSKVENNRFCISVHFRCVEEKKWSALAEEVRSVLADHPELRLTQGRKVLEIRPTIEWDKGKALQFLIEQLGLDDGEDILPLYIGDDRTDEDAFKLLRDRGQGFGILVSKFPKETCATYSLKDPSEVKDFLRSLIEWKRVSPKYQLLTM